MVTSPSKYPCQVLHEQLRSLARHLRKPNQRYRQGNGGNRIVRLYIHMDANKKLFLSESWYSKQRSAREHEYVLLMPIVTAEETEDVRCVHPYLLNGHPDWS